MRIDGTDRYEYFTYRLGNGPSGPGLLVTARAKSYGPPFLALGVEMSNVDSSNFAVSLAGRVTMYRRAGTGVRSEAGRDAGHQAAARRRTLQAALRHADLRRAARRIRSVAAQLLQRWRAGGRSTEVQRTGAGLDIGVNAGRNLEFRAGFDVADVRGTIRVGSPELPEAKGTERFASAQFIYDGQDSPIVPSQGVYLSGVVRRYFSTARSTSPTRR